MCEGKRSQPSPVIGAWLINKAMNSRSKGCKNTDSLMICVNKRLVASPATETSLQSNWASVHTKRMEATSAAPNTLDLWRPKNLIFFTFFCFGDSTRRQVKRKEARVDWGCGQSIGTHHPQTCPVRGPQVWNDPSTKSTITAVWAALRRETGPCGLPPTIGSLCSVQSIQQAEV